MLVNRYDFDVLNKVYNEMRLNNTESDAYNEALKDLELLIKILELIFFRFYLYTAYY